MIKYKIKHKIVNCENTDSVTSHDLYPPPPVTNCHTFSNPLPLGAWHTLWTAPSLKIFIFQVLNFIDSLTSTRDLDDSVKLSALLLFKSMSSKRFPASSEVSCQSSGLLHSIHSCRDPACYLILLNFPYSMVVSTFWTISHKVVLTKLD